MSLIIKVRSSRSFKAVGTATDRSATYDFMLVIHSTYRLSHTASEVNGDFSSES